MVQKRSKKKAEIASKWVCTNIFLRTKEPLSVRGVIQAQRLLVLVSYRPLSILSRTLSPFLRFGYDEKGIVLSSVSSYQLVQHDQDEEFALFFMAVLAFEML